MQIHTVLHISLLDQYSLPIMGHPSSGLRLSTVDDCGYEWEVERIVDDTESYTILSSEQVTTASEQAGSGRKTSRMLNNWSMSFTKYTRENCGGEWREIWSFVFFVLIILYSLYLEYDSPLLPSASGLAG